VEVRAPVMKAVVAVMGDTVVSAAMAGMVAVAVAV
jgi:hypothetical protein